MAGPCSVESEKQIMQAAGRRGRKPARKCYAAGRVQAANFALRFSGMEEEGLKLLKKAQAGHGTGDHHGSDDRPRCGFGRTIRRDF